MLPFGLMQVNGIPICLVPNLIQQQLNLNPHSDRVTQTGTGQSQISNQTHGLQQPSPNLNEQRVQKTEKSDSINAGEESCPKSKVQAPQSDQKRNEGEEKTSNKANTKAKRPQNYLTERAFYMKKKLKAKQKSDRRVLRKRQNDKTKVNIKGALRSVEQKKKKESSKKTQKGKSIKKMTNQLGDKKNLQKIKSKILKQYSDELATVPSRIAGIVQLNEFCNAKMESLLKRRVRFL